jgi:hypothetical protein
MDWMYDQQTRNWKLAAGEWRATVRRLMDSDAWLGVVERTGSHHERFESENFQWPHDGRAWCEAEIARLASRS